jgi:uncharacterized membrane protein
VAAGKKDAASTLADDSLLEILKRRYAQDEIRRGEFEAKKKELV